MNQTLIIVIVAALAFVAIVGIGFTFTTGQDDVAKKRAREIGAGRMVANSKASGKAADDALRRRAKTQEMLENLVNEFI